MKRVRTALPLMISFCLVVLSPGGNAWALALVSGLRAVPVAPGVAAVGAVSVAGMPTVTFADPAFVPSFFSSVERMPVFAAAPAADVAVSAASVQGPVTKAFDGVRRELPDFSRLGDGGSKAAASADFMARVGEEVVTATVSSPVLKATVGGQHAGIALRRAARLPVVQKSGVAMKRTLTQGQRALEFGRGQAGMIRGKTVLLLAGVGLMAAGGGLLLFGPTVAVGLGLMKSSGLLALGLGSLSVGWPMLKEADINEDGGDGTSDPVRNGLGIILVMAGGLAVPIGIGLIALSLMLSPVVGSASAVVGSVLVH